MSEPLRIMFLYWGRRGALTKFAHDLHSAALADVTIRPLLSVSRQSENFADYARFGSTVFPVDTYAGGIGALSGLWRVPQLGRALADRVARDHIQAVVTLMPHVWTPFVIPYIRRAGALYATIIHDARPHPGDRTALVHRLFLHEAARADKVVTLSRAVGDALVAGGHVRADRVTALFHPDLVYERDDGDPGAPTGEQPLRLLFFGRIMRYKGLGVLVEALELLKGEGIEVQLGVYGEGSLAPYRQRLSDLGAEVVNRWLGEDEIGPVFARYDAVALSHVEASQSGVAAAAFGAGLPVIATPVGGLREQVVAGVNGVLSASSSAGDYADAIARLAADRALLRGLRQNLLAHTQERSMKRFVSEIAHAVLDGAQGE